MPIAADYPFLDVLWTMIIFFCWVVWIWMMVVILGDVFRRRDIGGWSKAAWCVFMIVLPFIGVLTYLIAQHDGMAQRNAESAKAMQKELDDHIRAVATNGDGGTAGGAASEIEKAMKLRDSGAITPQEFEEIKAKTLAFY